MFHIQWIFWITVDRNIFLFSLPSLLCRCRERFSMQNPDAPRTKKGTTSSNVTSSCPTCHAYEWMSDELLFPRVSATPCVLISNADEATTVKRELM